MKLKTMLTCLAVASGVLASASWAEDTVLRFSWWGGKARHEATMKAIKLFEERNPGVKIKAEYGGFSGYQKKLTENIEAGAEADVMQINWAWIANFSRQGTGFYDMYQQKQHLKLDEFLNQSYKSGLVWGKLNALPVSSTARIFLWQKSTFDKAGVPLPKTWDDLFAAGRAFQQKLGDDYYLMDGDLYDSILMSHAYIYQKTGKPYIYPNQAKVALTVEEAQDWIALHKRLAAEHVIVPLPKRVAAGTGGRPTEQQADWISGKWAGNYAWDSTLRLRMSTAPRSTKFEVGPFITMPGAKNSGYFGRPSMMFAVSKNTKAPAMAVRFVNFLLTDRDAAAVLGSERGMPISKTGAELVQKTSMLSNAEIQGYAQVKGAKIDNPSPYFEHPRIQSFMREVFEAVAYGRIGDREAAEKLVNEGNVILRKVR